MHPSKTHSRSRARRPAGQGRAVIALGLAAVVSACSGNSEKPVAQAKPGDTLVVSGTSRVVLERRFRPGMPNGLYGGVVRVIQPGSQERRLVVNGICSMPGLESEGWPSYDNLYGKRLPGQARWQVLFHFDGRIEADKAGDDQPWLARLRDNICRRGSFSDQRKTASKN